MYAHHKNQALSQITAKCFLFVRRLPPLYNFSKKSPTFHVADHFLKILSKKTDRQIKITEPDMKKLVSDNWPGNVRELQNVIGRDVILNSGSRFKMPEFIQDRSKGPTNREDITLTENERRHILWALQTTLWKLEGKAGAAELLDIHPSTLYYRMRKLGIKRPKYDPKG